MAALGTLEQEPAIRAVVQLDEQGHVLERKNNPKMPGSYPSNRKDAVFTASLFLFFDSCPINSNV